MRPDLAAKTIAGALAERDVKHARIACLHSELFIRHIAGLCLTCGSPAQKVSGVDDVRIACIGSGQEQGNNDRS